MNEITPLPWKVTPFGEIYSDENGDFIWVATDTDEADGQFIVGIVNSYPALLAAARALLSEVSIQVLEYHDGDWYVEIRAQCYDALRAAVEASAPAHQ